MRDVCLCVNNDIRYCYSLTSTVTVQVISWESSFVLSQLFSMRERTRGKLLQAGLSPQTLALRKSGMAAQKNPAQGWFGHFAASSTCKRRRAAFYHPVHFTSTNQQRIIESQTLQIWISDTFLPRKKKKKKRAFWWSKIIWAGWHTQRW